MPPTELTTEKVPKGADHKKSNKMTKVLFEPLRNLIIQVYFLLI